MREAGLTDRQLLDRVVHENDLEAFQSLVARHDSSVRRVYRTALKDPHEAGDVFQAAFIVLARRAPDIQAPEALGAPRIAARVRRHTARRRDSEKTRAEMSQDQPAYAPVEGAMPSMDRRRPRSTHRPYLPT